MIEMAGVATSAMSTGNKTFRSLLPRTLPTSVPMPESDEDEGDTKRPVHENDDLPKCRRQCGPLMLTCWLALLTTIILIIQGIIQWLDNIVENDRFWEFFKNVMEERAKSLAVFNQSVTSRW